MLSRFATAATALTILIAGALAARADVLVIVNKSTQRLSVSVNGVPRYEWPVSTARWGYRTPNGTYRPERLERQWYSRKYDNSPMPYSIFFDGGYAIHGSYEISRIGRPASHGCIRLYPRNAAVLFRLVEANRDRTRIVVTGERREASAYRPRRVDPERRVYSEQRERARRRVYSERAEQPSPRYRAYGRRYRRESFEGIFSDDPPGTVYYGDEVPDRDYRVQYRWNR
jgi:hypothetical protein